VVLRHRGRDVFFVVFVPHTIKRLEKVFWFELMLLLRLNLTMGRETKMHVLGSLDRGIRGHGRSVGLESRGGLVLTAAAGREVTKDASLAHVNVVVFLLLLVVVGVVGNECSNKERELQRSPGSTRSESSEENKKGVIRKRGSFFVVVVVVMIIIITTRTGSRGGGCCCC
jgi:hypothetical protein